MSIVEQVAAWDAEYGSAWPQPTHIPLKDGHPRQVCYKVEGLVIPADTLTFFAKIVQSHIEKNPLAPAEIGYLRPRELNAYEPSARDRFNDIAQLIGCSEVPQTDTAVIFCEWSSLHMDLFDHKQAFVSVVAHTGPHPYVLQSVCAPISGDRGRTTRLATKTVALEIGDVVVFDAEEPHFAAPARPVTGQLLVLLQFLKPLQSIGDLLNLYRSFPPKN